MDKKKIRRAQRTNTPPLTFEQALTRIVRAPAEVSMKALEKPEKRKKKPSI